MRLAAIATAGAAAAAAILTASAIAAGTFGLLVAADAVAVAVLLALLITTLGPGAPAARSRATRQFHGVCARAWTRVLRRRRIQAAGNAGGFPVYRKIRSELDWAAVSMRHYDHAVRPLLSRLLRGALQDRHRVDPVSDPAQARDLVGLDLWPLLDPARPASDDSDTPGVDLATLSQIVTRLEQL